MAPNLVYDMPAPRSLILRMDITNSCNLDCIGCSLSDHRKLTGELAGSMNLPVFEKLATQVFPYLKEVALSCEAEPAMHPRFNEVMRILAEKTARGSALPVRMTTNGTLLSTEKLDAIFDAGIFGLAVSIDGFSPQTFSRLRKHGDMSKVCAAMDEIVHRKTALGRRGMDLPRLQINFTLMKSTIHELLPLIDYARRWELENFTVTHIYSTDTRDMSRESVADQAEIADGILIEAERKCREYGMSPRFPLLFHPRPQESITAQASRPFRLLERIVHRFRPAPVPPIDPFADLACAAPWSMLKIRWDGGVHPCDLWDFRFPIGNLETQSFEEIWNSEPYIELRHSLAICNPSYEPCIKCDRISQDNLEKRKLKSPLTHTSIRKSG
jgi:radical SAM protein with 4Fe4S-binding SPASM domain